jgi:NADPH:quinone reductase-like Zn-dependent oxidoreductase
MMRAIEIERPGGPEVLRMIEMPRPVPKVGEVVMRVFAAGVNRPDISVVAFIRRRRTHPRFRASMWPASSTR